MGVASVGAPVSSSFPPSLFSSEDSIALDAGPLSASASLSGWSEAVLSGLSSSISESFPSWASVSSAFRASGLSGGSTGSVWEPAAALLSLAFLGPRPTRDGAGQIHPAIPGGSIRGFASRRTGEGYELRLVLSDAFLGDPELLLLLLRTSSFSWFRAYPGFDS